MNTVQRTDTQWIPIIDGEVVDPDPTRAIPAPWLLPPVTTRYRTPRARLRRLRRRVRRSPFAADVRASADAAYWTGVVLAGLFLGLFVAVATRGHYLTGHGWQFIPTTGGTR